MSLRTWVGSMALVAGLWPMTAISGDGELEINQACAVETGCFAGDTAGFPVTIATPGSYLLTGDLSMLGGDVTAISITASDVTVDLHGFRIVCTIFVPPASVAPCGSVPGTAHGVAVDDMQTRARVEVHDGAVVGMRASGVIVGQGGVVRNLHISNNGATGLLAGTGSLLSGNTVSSNFGDGIEAATGSLIERNVVRSNSHSGIITGAESGLRGNVVTDNVINSVSGGVNIGGNLFCNTVGNCFQ